MTSSTFTTSIETPPPDPAKHVNFNQGMVLGAEDFTQEFAYLSGRDQAIARDTIGYGTVCGLHVALDSADFKQVCVSPGIAINPRGQIIRVNVRQCAQLDKWLELQTTVDRMAELGISTTGDFTAYVVLCYRDCPTDEVPVPGEPCRCDTDTMAPSRIMDDFRLELILGPPPPPQLEEGALRDLIAWLREVEVADFEPTQADLDTFLQAIRDAMGEIASPPAWPPPDYFYGSPPAGLRIPRRALCQWMRAAMRLWVTELRPIWRAQCAPLATGSSDPCGCHGTGTEPDDMACDCVMLAAVTITRGSGGITGAVIDEEHRPFLVHLRMLEELLLCGPCCGSGCGNNRTFATVFPVDAHTLRIWGHHPIALDLPAEAVSLELNDTASTDFTISALGGNVFDLGLTASPLESLGAATSIELEFDASLITQTDGRDLATAIWQDGYCYADYSEPRLKVFAASGLDVANLAGDVVGLPTQNQLESIQGDPLDLTGLGDGQVLGFDSGVWRPLTLPAAPVVPQAGDADPQPDGAVAPGTSLSYAREDHVHPSQEITGDFVEHPKDAGEYHIVAAGILNRDFTVNPSYNDLKADPPEGERVLLSFKDYPPPSKTNAIYIVKGTLSTSSRQQFSTSLMLRTTE